MSVAVRSGPLRFVGRVQRASEVRSVSGMVTLVWADLQQHWRFGIEPMTLRGQEKLVGNQLLQDVTHVVRCRFIRGLRAKDRVIYQDGHSGIERTLEILSAADTMERHRMHELLCKEVV